MLSNAVGSERVSQIVGYLLKGGNFNTDTPNLPMRIAVLGEANNANQSNFTPNQAKEITSAQQAGQLYGYGSPIHRMMSILRPASGGLVGGIPTDVFAQAEASGATARILTLTVTGTATAAATHRLRIAGRTSLNGVPYEVNIAAGDTKEVIAAKIADAVNSVLGAPVTATHEDSPPSDEVVFTTKWKGLTAQDVDIEVETGDTNINVTYSVMQTQAATGTPSVSSALEAFGNTWYTIVINPYSLAATNVLDALEAYNGVPDPETPTGRYTGIIMRPFIALTGSTDEDPSSVTHARRNNVTIAICPAPNSKGLPMEAAANMCALFARVSQDTPHLDVSDKFYPDMPIPADGDIGAMASYDERDAIVKKGCSTVDLNAGRYQVKDFVTTYHKEGEEPPQYRYCRNLMIDFNVRYRYYLLELLCVVGHVIVNDNDTTTASNVVKPKTWKSVLVGLFEDLERDALIVNSDFSVENTHVEISNTNPDRLETFFRYMRSGFARISSTTAEAGFNYGGN